jgi:hypothetical protein
MTYEIRLKGGEAEVIEGADTYQQEGPLTTFFQTRPGRTVIDCWSRRVASYRTADIVRIRVDAWATATATAATTTASATVAATTTASATVAATRAGTGTEGTVSFLRDF